MPDKSVADRAVEPELLAAYEEMLRSEDIPLNMDDLCSTMGADSAPSTLSTGFVLPDRALRPAAVGRQQRRNSACMALSAAPRTEAPPPRVSQLLNWQKVDLSAGSTCEVTVRFLRLLTCDSWPLLDMWPESARRGLPSKLSCSRSTTLHAFHLPVL